MKKRTPKAALITLVLLLLVCSVVFTYLFTTAFLTNRYAEKDLERQSQIQKLEKELASANADLALYADDDFSKLNFLASLFSVSSYYSGDVSKEDLLNAVLKAYAEATGDNYAEYYTNEEYRRLVEDSLGNTVGIGVMVLNTQYEYLGTQYPVFEVFAISHGSPAESAGVQIGDLIYGFYDGDTLKGINALGGFNSAISAIRGEEGTKVKIAVWRPDGSLVTPMTFEMTRAAFVKESVTGAWREGDSTTAIIKINEFDLTTPRQLRDTIQAYLDAGASHFVLDVRHNPGGNLESIMSSASLFLQDGDLILSKTNRDGAVVSSYYASAGNYYGNAEICNLEEDDVGKFAHLDMVVLCDESTASAAEVFTATIRDYSLAPIVGVKTYGKGIIQSYLSLSIASGGVYDGYAKMTTYAYVTRCGVSYHGIGITPDTVVELDETAKTYSFYMMPQSADNQLQAAFAEFD